MQKITPFLWYDKEAGEASKFYTSVFGGKIKSKSVMTDTPSGTVEIITIEILGQEFTLMSAGPIFKINPSISFLVACKSMDEVDALWKKLSKGGQALMELGQYPFSQLYGWIQDKYGVSWQLMFMGEQKVTQRIIPTMMFVGKMAGKADEARKFYASVFKQSSIGDAMRYEKGEEPDKAGTLKHGRVTIEGQEFAVMDSAIMHQFAINEAISFVVNCKNQKEVDYYWEKLSFVPESEQCGWVKDKFGVSWQITPVGMEKMLNGPDKKKAARAVQAMLQMKKLDIKKLQEAYDSG